MTRNLLDELTVIASAPALLDELAVRYRRG